MEGREIVEAVERDINEMAELRADVLLLKKQISRQDKTILPGYSKVFYAIILVMLGVFLGVEVIQQHILVGIYHSVASIDQKLEDGASSITPVYEKD